MKSVTRILLTALAPVLFGSASAQESLTLEACRALAIENNRQLAIAAENTAKSEFDVRAYRANFLPKVSAVGNYLFTTTSLKKSIPGNYLPTYVPDGTGALVPNILTTVDGVPLFKEYALFPDMDIDLKFNGTYMAGLSVEQPIYMGGKVTSAYRMARVGREISALNEVKTRAEVIVLADEAYWTYVQTQELARTAHSYRELIEQLLRDVQNAFDAGMKPRNDLLKVQVRLNEARLQVAQAENGVRLAQMNLCHVLGLPLTTRIATAETLAEEPAVNLPDADISARPEYAMLSKQIELKTEQVRFSRSEFLPQIGVQGNFGYANGLKLNGDKMLDKASLSAVVSVSVPLFHWGEGRNRVRSARIEQQIASIQRDDLSEQMELELRQVRNQLDEANLEVALTARSLEQATENRRESRDRYEVGLETLSDLLEAQTLWQQADSELIRARTAARLSLTRYLKAAGRL